MYILDTNTLIYFFKGMGNVAGNLLAESTSPKKRKKQLEELCALVVVLTFGEEEARISAIIRASLEKKGTPIGPYDILIAGTALGKQGVLVTNNTKAFRRVPGLEIINWL